MCQICTHAGILDEKPAQEREHVCTLSLQRPSRVFSLDGHADEMCRRVFGYCAVLVHNIMRRLSGVNGEIFWPGRFFYCKSSVVSAFGKGKRATISICEKEKRWRLLASQTGVILLATLLLFLSLLSY